MSQAAIANVHMLQAQSAHPECERDASERTVLGGRAGARTQAFTRMDSTQLFAPALHCVRAFSGAGGRLEVARDACVSALFRPLSSSSVSSFATATPHLASPPCPVLSTWLPDGRVVQRCSS